MSNVLPHSVIVARVEERLVARKQRYVGTIKPVRRSMVSSPVDGEIIACLAVEGDFVAAKDGNAGAPLVVLRTKPVEIDLAVAEAELRARTHKLAELKLSAPLVIEQAQAQKEAAEASMNYARWRVNHTQELRRRGAASEFELEEQRAAAQSATKAYVEREAAWELAKSGLWKERIEQAEASIEAQKQTIDGLKDDMAQHAVFTPFDGYVIEKYAEVGQWVTKGDPIMEVVKIDDVYVEVPVPEEDVARVRTRSLLFRVPNSCRRDLNRGVLPSQIQENLTKCGIRFSSSHGERRDGDQAVVRVEKENSRWQIVGQGQQGSPHSPAPACVVIQRESLEVCRAGTAACVELGALPGKTFWGDVVAVVPSGDLRSRCFLVKVLLRNPDAPNQPANLLLKPGMFARVTLSIDMRPRLMVPKDSLVIGEATLSVWVVEPASAGTPLGPGKATRITVEVQLGAADNEGIEIVGPLKDDGSLPLQPGQLVVVEGNERLIPGRSVNVLKMKEWR